MQQSETLPAFVDLNVLPEELRPRRYPVLFVVGILALLAASLALFPVYQAGRAARNETAPLQAEMNVISSELALAQLDLGKVRELQGQLEAVQAEITVLNEEREATLGDGQEMSSDLAVAVLNLPPGVGLASVTGGDGRMTLAGQALTSGDVFQYVSALRKSGRFSEARIVSLSTATDEAGGSGVMFTVEAVR